MTRRNWLLTAGIASTLLLLGILGSILCPHLNRRLQDAPAQAIVLSANSACKPVGGSCTVSDPALTITLSLGETVQPLTAFPVRVKLAGKLAEGVNSVAVRFTMTGMDMGINRFSLNRQPEKVWRGQALLPACISGRRDWQASVEIESQPPYIGKFYLLISP